MNGDASTGLAAKEPKKVNPPSRRMKKVPLPKMLGPFVYVWKKADGKKTVSGLGLALAGALLILIPKQVGVSAPVLDAVGWKMMDAGLAMAFGIGIPHKIFKWLRAAMSDSQKQK